MTRVELIEKLKKNLPEEYRDKVDDFADVLQAFAIDELTAIVGLSVQGNWRKARKLVVSKMSLKELIASANARNDAMLKRVAANVKSEAEAKAWLTGVLQQLMIVGIKAVTG